MTDKERVSKIKEVVKRICGKKSKKYAAYKTEKVQHGSIGKLRKTYSDHNDLLLNIYFVTKTNTIEKRKIITTKVYLQKRSWLKINN